MGRARLAERVEVGYEMTEIAVGVDQADNADLAAGIESRRGHAADPQLEPFKEQPPAFIDRGRILSPLLVVRLDDIQVPVSRNTRTGHGRNLRARPAERRGKFASPTSFKDLAAVGTS